MQGIAGSDRNPTSIPPRPNPSKKGKSIKVIPDLRRYGIDQPKGVAVNPSPLSREQIEAAKAEHHTHGLQTT